MSPYNKKDNELLEKVQRRFTKMTVNMDVMSYEDRPRSLKLQTRKVDLIFRQTLSNGKLPVHSTA